MPTDRVALRVLSAGLYAGVRALQVSAYPDLVRDSVRGTELTGAHFGAGHRRTVAGGSAVMDSTDAATGLEALLAQPGADSLRTLEAIQHAWALSVPFGADRLLDGLDPWHAAAARLRHHRKRSHIMSEVSAASVPTIAVTGSTGRLGGRVARRLAERGVPQKLLVRSPERAPRLPGAVAVRGDYADQDAVREALAGTRTVFMVSASESADRLAQHEAFVDAVVEAGVRHLVYVSFYGAAPDATFTLARDHFHTEQHIRASGLAYTFLRDNFYAEFVPDLVGEDGVIRGPAGQGRAAFVGQDDIADAAAAVLSQPDDHTGIAYDLTGPESLTLDEAAAILSEQLGRTITYQQETVEEAYASRASYGAPPWQLDAWVSTYTAIASGELDGVSNAVPRLTGHPATPLADVVRATGG